MKKLFIILTTAFLLIATACSGDFTDPGMLDQPGGGSGGNGGGGDTTIPTIPTIPTGSKTNPFPLTANTWTNGNITSTSQEIWYSFNVTAGRIYYVWWKDNDGGYNTGDGQADIKVTAFYSNNQIIFSEDIGWNAAQPIAVASKDTVLLRVIINNGRTGIFAIAYTTTDNKP